MSEIEDLRAEVERLRHERALIEAVGEAAVRRAQAAEARLRSVEVLADEWAQMQPTTTRPLRWVAYQVRERLAAEPVRYTGSSKVDATFHDGSES